MIQVRKSAERGHLDHGWLDTRHTFSFADYNDPRYMGFRSLRVINEDRVAPGTGFGEHSHRDMEILTYVISGQLQHRDSLGNGAVLNPGEIQYMSAGTGIVHAEFNPSPTDPVHFIQIWILPEKNGGTPRYASARISGGSQGLSLLASPDGEQAAMAIRQDVKLWAGTVSADQRADLAIAEHRYAWIQMLSGQVSLNGTELAVGDGAAVSDESHLSIESKAPSQFLYFDLR